MTPTISNRFLYSDGILAEPGHPANSYINTLSSTLLLNLGSHWVLDYTPTWISYTNRVFNNSLGHAFRLAGAATFQNWSLGFNQSYTKSSNTLIETARQTEQQVSSTALSLGYRFTDKLRLDSSNTQNLQFIEGSSDSFSWSTQNWLDYQVSSRLRLALGGAAGLVQVYRTSDSYYFEPGARVTLKATDKLNLNLSGGLERRRFLGHRARTLQSPTLSGSLDYQPGEATVLSFSASRNISVSFFAGSVTENQLWSLSLNQRILKHFTLRAEISGGKTRYESTTLPTPPTADTEGSEPTVFPVISGRDDSYHSYSFDLSTTLLRRATIGVFYHNTNNSSNFSGFGFASHQIGGQLGLRF